ncbi:hypothetical protein BJF93_17000 [Xaviernesmea oryzae]|uniref:AzlD family protein n=1 Tax=Xaviernesmea oryzae TaxID=464029 RepID=A0A1Q9AT38_9HYPH|nr:AzlD domain-containing protein [Xaviernesmea oryzae]OLP58558.1 hypothetical protein BJF93_17000 [Xaviernesmea oryzae]SEK61814.1 Uncharacterized membrane protein [Xaviernesmea oryzae]
MSLDPATLAAILAMATATLATRLAGAFLVRRMTLSPRLERALNTVPPAVLMAVVAPTALATGLAETTACALTAIAALRLPMLAAAGLGVATVAVLRAVGL